jgi:hypothetical protein
VAGRREEPANDEWINGWKIVDEIRFIIKEEGTQDSPFEPVENFWLS